MQCQSTWHVCALSLAKADRHLGHLTVLHLPVSVFSLINGEFTVPPDRVRDRIRIADPRQHIPCHFGAQVEYGDIVKLGLGALLLLFFLGLPMVAALLELEEFFNHTLIELVRLPAQFEQAVILLGCQFILKLF